MQKSNEDPYKKEVQLDERIRFWRKDLEGNIVSEGKDYGRIKLIRFT